MNLFFSFALYRLAQSPFCAQGKPTIVILRNGTRTNSDITIYQIAESPFPTRKHFEVCWIVRRYHRGVLGRVRDAVLQKDGSGDLFNVPVLKEDRKVMLNEGTICNGGLRWHVIGR